MGRSGIFTLAITFILFSAAFSAHAKEVTLDQAWEVSQAWVALENERALRLDERAQLESKVTKSKSSKALGKNVQDVYPLPSAEQVEFYAVELFPTGLMIVPTLTELAPVKLIMDNGDLSLLATHPGVKAVVGELRENTQALRKLLTQKVPFEQHVIPVLQTNEESWNQLLAISQIPSEVLENVYSPGTNLLETAWNQGAPYNLFTPVIGAETATPVSSVTGCTATAMAQIMKYWNWPPRGEPSSDTYKWNEAQWIWDCLGIEGEATGDHTHSKNFDTMYSWDDMALTYPASTEANIAVAELMKDVGYSTNMNYKCSTSTGTPVSGASNLNVDVALQEYFRYKDSVYTERCIGDTCQSANDWFNHLRNDLDMGMPIQFEIRNLDDGGHSVVVDGWRNQGGIDQIKINFGWGEHPANDVWYTVGTIWTFDKPNGQKSVTHIYPQGPVLVGVDPGSGYPDEAGRSTFTVSYRNEGGSSVDGYITISIPDITSASQIVSTTSSVTSSGGSIYVTQAGQSMTDAGCTSETASYVIIDAQDPNWADDEVHWLTVEYELNGSAGTQYPVYYRASSSTVSACPWANEVAPWEGDATDQQGYQVHQHNETYSLPEPTICVGPDPLKYDLILGGSAVSSDLTVKNCGTGTLQWEAVESSPWVSFLNTASGSLAAGQTYQLQVSASPSSLSIGDHSANVTVRKQDDSEPQTVSVQATVRSTNTDPDVVEMNPSMDTYVTGQYPNTSYGGAEELKFGRMNLEYSEYSYIQFDLSPLDGETEIESAELVMWVKTTHVDCMEAAAAEESWDDSDDYYDVSPPMQVNNRRSTTVHFNDGVYTEYTLNVANAVEDWLDGQENYGFQVHVCDTSDYGRFQIASREYSNASMRPLLKVTRKKPFPDLEVISFDVTEERASYYVGEKVNMRACVRNNGPGDAESTRIGYYLNSSFLSYDGLDELYPNESDCESDYYTFESSDIGSNQSFSAIANYNDVITDDTNSGNDELESGSFEVIWGPQLQVTPSTLGWTVYEGESITPKTFSVSNTKSGTDPLEWSATSTVEWLTLSQSSGTTPYGSPVTVEILPITDGLALGSHTGNVNVNAQHGLSGTVAVTVIINQCNAPGTFALSSPADGAEDQPTTSVTLQWGDASGVDNYQVQFGKQGDQAPPAYEVTVSELGVGPLEQGTRYEWRVMAVSACGGVRSSDLWSFTTEQTLEDTEDPLISITSPTTDSTYTTSSSTIDLSGTASDNVAVTEVTWSNDRSGSGTADGTSTWSETSIALYSGSNVLTVTAHDAAGNTSSDTLTVTYNPPGNVGITSFFASPTTIVEGASTTISWSTINADSCTASGGFGGWSGAVAVNGSQAVSTATAGTYTFTLTCQGTGGPVSASTTVTVNSEPSVAIISFTASPSSILEGESTTISWVTENAMVCTPTDGVGLWNAVSITLPTGSVTIPINATGSYTFTLTCNGLLSDSDTASVIVTVNSTQPPSGNGLLINEIVTGATDRAEVYNASSNVIDLVNVILEVNGDCETEYWATSSTFPLGPGQIATFEAWDCWTSGGSGSLSLMDIDTFNGLDFVRWGGSAMEPPAGTSWSGDVSSPPDDGSAIGRDEYSVDTNLASDWCVQAPTFNTVNLSCDSLFCNRNTVSGVTDYSTASHEACDLLVVGPAYVAENSASVTLSSGKDIVLLPGFQIEQGATLDANVCGQSLCETSPYPMPDGCHSCVTAICDAAVDPHCCTYSFDSICLGEVETVCGLVCE